MEGKGQSESTVLVDGKLYKKDNLVTVEDINRLVEEKRIELGVIPWSELKVTPTKE